MLECLNQIPYCTTPFPVIPHLVWRHFMQLTGQTIDNREERSETHTVVSRDINCTHLYGSCYTDPLKFGTWAFTQQWALGRDTMVYMV